MTGVHLARDFGVYHTGIFPCDNSGATVLLPTRGH